MLKFLQKYKEKREQKLTEKRNREKWILVSQLSGYVDYIDRHYYSYSLFENLLSERKFQFNIDKEKASRYYLTWNFQSFSLYHNLVKPWIDGAELKDIPNSLDILSDIKKPYLKAFY